MHYSLLLRYLGTEKVILTRLGTLFCSSAHLLWHCARPGKHWTFMHMCIVVVTCSHCDIEFPWHEIQVDSYRVLWSVQLCYLTLLHDKTDNPTNDKFTAAILYIIWNISTAGTFLCDSHVCTLSLHDIYTVSVMCSVACRFKRPMHVCTQRKDNHRKEIPIVGVLGKVMHSLLFWFSSFIIRYLIPVLPCHCWRCNLNLLSKGIVLAVSWMTAYSMIPPRFKVTIGSLIICQLHA